MATTVISASQMTLLELARRTDPNGELTNIAEVLVKVNPMIGDAVWMMANNKTSHQMTRRTYQPTGTFRQYNAGVAAEHSRTTQVNEGIGMLESYSEVDVALIKLASNEKEARNQEVMAFIEGLGQTLASTLLYGNTATDPEKFDGLATRMGTVDADGLVINEGGSGSDLSSIYIVRWGLGDIFMIYPQGATAGGIKHRDLGEDTKIDSNSKMWQVYRDHFAIHCGLAQKDPRSTARLANIETSGTSNIFDEDNLITLMNRMKQSGSGGILYVNPTILTQMEIALKDKSNVNYTPSKGEGLAGDEVLRFRNKPVKIMEAILSTEAAIS